MPVRTGKRTVTSFFEFWPGWLFYIPTVTAWLLMGARYRGFSLPTAANPHVEAGGLCGERKASILDQAGPLARAAIAPYCTMTTGADDLALALRRIAEAGLALPLVVKPNIGCNGNGVRLVRDEAALAAALAAFSRGVELVIQRLVEDEHEAGLFYVRMPDEPRGRLTSLTLKRAPFVTGDGVSTLKELVMADPRYGSVPDIYLPRLHDRLDEVLPPGERFRLVFAGNHCKGSVFENGTALVTPALEARVDAILRDLPDFHFGRVDVKFDSLARLRDGDGFTVIEINGVGSEATHIWDPSTTLRDAYLDQFRHYRDAFLIGRAMRKKGFRPTRPFELLGYWMHQRRLMRSYPLND
ncbi:MAG: D-alanine--D-alanine ligase [Gluconacetobacter diazotrophicus]|nr:D-alanine--D-alanine ligase [Gluconacetobacter diazotrophicus]